MSDEQPSAKKYRAALEQTVAEEEFSAASVRSKLEPPIQELPTSAAPLIDEPGLSAKGPASLSGFNPAVDRYELGTLLGSGATGEVYLARDRNFQRDVAVKILRKERVGDREKLLQFIQEARVTARLEHPNILPIYDVNFTSGGGQIYFTMRRAEGLSLLEALRTATSGRPPAVIAGIRERIGIFMKLCDAVAYAHNRGVVHQDIKPGNIMLGQYGEVVLVDWGTATSSDERETGDRKILGTPAYMSPKQARRERADERSDVYCLGATLFHMLTLRHPTWSDNPDEFWEKKRRGNIDPLSAEEQERIPALLLNVALKAMAPDSKDRYASVADLQNGIRLYETHSESIALAVRAREGLGPAVKNRDYAAFNEVIFGFRQALALWDANDDARLGLSESRLRHAECALSKGDFELAASALDPNDQMHADAFSRVRLERRKHDDQQRRGRRFRYAAAGLVLAIAALAAYAGYEYYLRVAPWVLVYGPEQYGSKSPQELWVVKDLLASKGGFEVELHADGLRLNKHFGANTLAILDLPCGGDSKIEFDLELPPQEHQDGVKIGLFSDIDSQIVSPWQELDGYSLYLACYGWKRTQLLKSHARPLADIDGFVPKIGKTYHIVVGRDEGTLFFTMDGETAYRIRDLLPYLGQKHSRFFVGACMTMDFSVHNLKVYTRVPAQRVQPTAIADVLYERGDFTGALAKYTELARTYTNTETSEEASAKACALALVLATNSAENADGSTSGFSLTDTRDMALRHLQQYPGGPWNGEVIKTLLIALVKLRNFDEVVSKVHEYYNAVPPRVTVQYVCSMLDAEKDKAVPESNDSVIDKVFETKLAILPVDDLATSTTLSAPPHTENALKLLDKRVAQFSDRKQLCSALLLCKVHILNNLNRFSKAQDAWLAAQRIDPKVEPDIDTLWGLGKFSESISILKERASRARRPYDKPTHQIILAQKLEGLGRFDDADNLRRETKALDPTLLNPFRMSPQTTVTERLTSSSIQLERVRELIVGEYNLYGYPYSALRNIAWLCDDLEKSDEALQAIREAQLTVETSPMYGLQYEDLIDAKIQVARILMYSGRYSDALDAYAQVHENSSVQRYFFAMKLTGEALSLLGLKRVDEATEKLREIVRTYPELNSGAVCDSARLLLGELNPDDVPTLKEIQDTALDQMHFKVRFSAVLDCQHMLGWLALRRYIENKDEEACRLFERANTEYAQEFLPKFYLALCRKLGKTPRAIPCFEKPEGALNSDLIPTVLKKVLAWRTACVETTRRKALIKASINHLVSADPFVRIEALNELKRIGPASADALPAIQKIATDPDASVREAAKAAIAAIQPDSQRQ